MRIHQVKDGKEREGLKQKKKLIGLLALTLGIMMGTSMQSFAAKKIKTVSIKITDEFKVGEEYSEDDVEITTKSKYFTVSDVLIMNEDDVWESSTVPMLEIYLTAEDGYYFSTKAADIQIRGGEYVKGRREDSQNVILTVRLPSLQDQVGEIESAGWSSKTVASWSSAYNTGRYELYLYRDGKSAGSAEQTSGTSYDFASMMRRPGEYTYKVRAVNYVDTTERSEWRESDSSSYIDDATAEQFRNLYGDINPTGATEPGQAMQQAQNQQFGWIHDNIGGWWYRNSDGGYTTDNWQFINGKWYYFNSIGYMVTGWVDWNGKSYYCDPVNGDMLVNTIVPDGSGRRVDSTGAWIQ